MVLAPVMTDATPSVFVMDRLATGVTVSVSLAVLLAGVGSTVPTGVVTMAVFVTFPLKAVTFAVIVIS
jgi:hypothetical protein